MKFTPSLTRSISEPYLDELERTPQLIDFLTQTVLVKRREEKGKGFQIRVEYDLPFIKIVKTPESGSETYRLDVFLVKEKMTRGKINSTIRVFSNDKEIQKLMIPVVGEVN